MKEATKNSLKNLVKILLGFGAFALFATYVPDDSIFKKIFAILILAVLVLGVVWYTPLGNPIKRYLRKRKERKGL